MNIFWIMLGPRSVASSRIHGYRIHEALKQRGRSSTVIFDPLHVIADPPLNEKDIVDLPVFHSGDIVCFQKVTGPCTRSLLQALRSKGIWSVFIDSDLPLKIAEAHLATKTVCSSQWLADQYVSCGVDAACIPDATEAEHVPYEAHSDRTLNCVWFGNGSQEKWLDVKELRELIERRIPECTLSTISNHLQSDLKWELASVFSAISNFDAVLLPGREEPHLMAKSANRAIQAMALGVPVVAFPTPANQSIIRSGRNGFLCRTEDEWVEAIAAIRDSNFRRNLAAVAYRYSRRFFSIDRTVLRWEELFGQILGRPLPLEGSQLDEQRVRALQDCRRLIYTRVAQYLEEYVVLHAKYRIEAGSVLGRDSEDDLETFLRSSYEKL